MGKRKTQAAAYNGACTVSRIQKECGNGLSLNVASVRLTLYTYLYNSLGPHNCIYTSSTCAKKSSFIIHYVERKENYLTTTAPFHFFFEKNKWFMMWNCFFFLGKFTMHFTLEHWLSFQLWPLDGAQVEAPICESWYGCPLVVRSWTNLYFLFLSLLLSKLSVCSSRRR